MLCAYDCYVNDMKLVELACGSYVLRLDSQTRGGGTGGRVGRGARRTREPVRRNNETIGELDGQGNDRGVKANGGVGGVPDFSNINCSTDAET
ncbi:hypothetical protein Tco_0369754 [Tanacetum coccineum]